MLTTATAYLASRLPEVDIPKPGAPDPDDIIDKGNDGSNWLAEQGTSFWTIVIIAVVALLIMKFLKNPLIKGAVIGIILIGIVMAVMNN